MKNKLFVSILFALSLSIAACGSTSGDKTSAETLISTEDKLEVSTDETSKEESSQQEEVSEETSEENISSLKDEFAKHNIKAGTCISGQMLSYVDQIALIKDNFNSITMENAMKPDAILNQKASIENGELTVEFSKEATRILDFAKKNGMSMRGHTLVWYSQTPSWIFYEDFSTKNSLVSREVMLDRMESLIRKTFEVIEELGYTNLFYAYDVVNEAWMEDGSMRDCLWKQTIGDDYLWYAFYFADKYAPESVDLYYNDYNEQFKADTLVKFVNTLVNEDGKYLIDGIGLQAHLYTGDNLDNYFKMIDKLSETGLKIQMTELDVCLGSYQNPLKATDDNLKKQGRFYYNLLNGIFERIDAGSLKMDAVTFWGVSDKASWRSEYSPLLFDGKLNPKYAFYGAIQDKENAGY